MRDMKRFPLLTIAAAALAPGGCAAAASLQKTAAEPAPIIFDTRSDPAFGDATVPLKVYLDRATPAPHGPQHFCVVGYSYSDGGRHAQVHWREGRRLILWDGASDPVSARDAIAMARDDLDLTQDVVATEAEIAGSSYRVTQAWVDRVLADCAAKGTSYTIQR